MRKLTRTMIARVGALLAGAALLSCTGPKPPEGKILVEFWDFPRLPAVNEWLLASIDKFEKENPEIDIQYTRLSWSKGGERMDIAAFARRPPDVAGAVLNVKYADADLLAPLDEYLDEPLPDDPTRTYRDDIYPNILKDVQWDGKTYAFPWYKEAFVILLNNDILRERGVEPPPGGQWTWEEFLEKMHALTFDRDSDGDIDVYGIGFSTGKEKWEAYSFLFAEGLELISADGRTMLTDTEATRRGMNRLLEMEFKEGISLPNAGGIQDDTTWSAFSGPERRLAATCQGLWSVKALQVSNERLVQQRAEASDPLKIPPPLDVTLVLFPQMPEQPQIMASYGGGSLMVFKRPLPDPKRTEAAARFARFLTLEQGQQINREAGLWPSRMSTGNLFEDYEIYENVAEFIPDAISPPTHPAWPQITQVIGEYLQLVLLRRIEVDKAVTDMTGRCQMILDRYWEEKELEQEEAAQ